MTEFLTLSLWESRHAITAFAGHQIERAVFYPDDDCYLVEREQTTTHFDVFLPAHLEGRELAR